MNQLVNQSVMTGLRRRKCLTRIKRMEKALDILKREDYLVTVGHSQYSTPDVEVYGKTCFPRFSRLGAHFSISLRAK